MGIAQTPAAVNPVQRLWWRLRAWMLRRQRAWVNKRLRASGNSQILTQRRIFILPTKQGVLFACTLTVLLVGSINYGLNLGMLLTFLLAATALVAILHTFRNLAGVEVWLTKAEPVFAGGNATFLITLDSRDRLGRFHLEVSNSNGLPRHVDLPPRKKVSVSLNTPATRRGWLSVGKLVVATRYPLGLFRAWSNIYFDARCLVYPRPDETLHTLPDYASFEANAGNVLGDTDFSGLRPYRPGDPLPRVAWKASAREAGLLTKQFSGVRAQERWLDWNELAALDFELRLARLTRWALLAEAAGVRYGLRVPGETIAPGTGAQHLERVLRTLALFGIADETGHLAA